jgi:adenine-specific DNA-methyltransferase
MARKTTKKKKIETIHHNDASRRNIPTAEYQSIVQKEDDSPLQIAYQRRNKDLDPQLVWKGKDEQDWSDLVVQAPPLYIQEKVHPKVLIDDLKKQTDHNENDTEETVQIDLFADFNGLPNQEAKTEFYHHDSNWSNRLILGDSLQVMASLTEREGLREQVQCIYFDPPYGIKFNSNFQWSTTSRDVKDGKAEHITREPEQVKAFRDTWRDGIHSYLTYLRDRLSVSRDLLCDSGSIFVQIGVENIHRIRCLLDEIFGQQNFVSQINFTTTSGFNTSYLASNGDIILWYAKNLKALKFRPSFEYIDKSLSSGNYRYVRTAEGKLRSLSKNERNCQIPLESCAKLYQPTSLVSQGAPSKDTPFVFDNKTYRPGKNQHWKTTGQGLEMLAKANRIHVAKNSIRYVRLASDFPVKARTNSWYDTATGNFTEDKLYVVQTAAKVIERCILMTTDPGDLVLDPTCGSGTTAYVSEQWGRRWITIDTSRVSLALARSRVMGARYPYYILADSVEGIEKEAELLRKAPSNAPTFGNIKCGFVYERVPHITLKSIAHNSEIDVIWEKYQQKLLPLREKLYQVLNKKLENWEIPFTADETWSEEAKKLHGEWLELRAAHQKEIDTSIASKADFEHLYDKPYENNKIIRVAGPFTVETLSPHRTLSFNVDDEFTEVQDQNDFHGFTEIILDNLRQAGVQQAHKDTKINFISLIPWPGRYICAEGRYFEGTEETSLQRRAAILIGPEFGTVIRPDLVAAAREAGDGDFDVLITCAFNYDAHSADFDKLGRIPVLKARMNADLHMADDLKNTGKGNLFVIFGEPDIDILTCENNQIQVRVNGVDVFHPNTGEIHSNNTDEIACWFIDTDYNEESFFVRHAYFLGANDPYKSLKTTLKAEINHEAWDSLHSSISRPFEKPESGLIAVKVINHLGDEVMKVYQV